MDQEAYRQYLVCKEQGRKAEAKAALEMFLASIEPEDDIRAWVEAFLNRGDFGYLIRHEIYEWLVFPVLLQGYKRGDAWSLMWLAKTANNLYRSSALHSRIGFKVERQLLAEAYRLSPGQEVRQLLLNSLLIWFSNCQHEWPAAILYGTNGADWDECDDLLQQVAFARELDDGSNAEFLKAFGSKVREYKERLQQRAK